MAESEQIYELSLWTSYGLNFISKKVIAYAKIVNNERIPHFSFQQKIDYEQTLNYTWP